MTRGEVMVEADEHEAILYADIGLSYLLRDAARR